jgi:hypothetical protein
MTIHPTALADQLDAASADAERRLRRAAVTPGVQFSHTDTPAWLAEQFTRIDLALTTGHGRLCPHIGAAPRVVYAFAWAPGLLTCPACRWLATPTDAEDHICDRCRRHAGTLYPTIAARGPVLFGYGLCHPCHTKLG